MSKLILLFLILVVRTVFTFVKPTGITMSFPFDDMVVSLEFYIYCLGEKLAFIILANMVAEESVKYRNVLWVFFWLMVADLVDFILIYNNEWALIGKFALTLNNIAAMIFAFVILKELLWEKRHIL